MVEWVRLSNCDKRTLSYSEHFLKELKKQQTVLVTTSSYQDRLKPCTSDWWQSARNRSIVPLYSNKAARRFSIPVGRLVNWTSTILSKIKAFFFSRFPEASLHTSSASAKYPWSLSYSKWSLRFQAATLHCLRSNKGKQHRTLPESVWN